MICKWKKPDWANKVKSIGGVIGLIACVISATVLAAIYVKTWVIIWQFFFVTILMPPIGSGIGYIISRMTVFIPFLKQSEANCRAIAIETGVQNTQLAVAIINIAPSFSSRPCIQAEMAVMPLLYLCVQTVWAFILIGSFVLYRRYHPEVEEKELQKNIDLAEKASVQSWDRAVARRKSQAALMFKLDDDDDSELGNANDLKVTAGKLSARRPTIFERFNRGPITSVLGGIGGAFVPVVDPDVEEEIVRTATVQEYTDSNGVRRRSVYPNQKGEGNVGFDDGEM